MRRGLRWFLIGRAASGVLGLVWLVLLVRTLPPAQLGTYFGLWSLFELTQLASGLGVVGYLQRYVALDVLHQPRRRFLLILVALLSWRLFTLAAAAAVLWAVWPLLAGTFGLAAALPGPGPLLALLAAEGTVRWCESAADSLLLQPLRQLLALLRNLLRIGWLTFAVTFTLHGATGIDAAAVLHMETVGACIVATVGLTALAWWAWRHGRRGEPGESAAVTATQPSWYVRLRFSVQGHLALMVALLTGLDSVKLLVASGAGVEALAVFGTAASLAEMMARHTPAQLMLEFLRSVLTARSGGAAPADETALHFWPRLLIRVNALVLAALTGLVLVVGDAALRLLGSPAPATTAALLGVLLLLQFVQAMRIAAGVIAHLLADGQAVLRAALATWVVPLIVIVSAPALGPWAGVVGLGSLEVLHAGVLLHRLRLSPAQLLGPPRLWRALGMAGGSAALVAAALVALLQAQAWAAGWVVAGGAGVFAAVYALLLWRYRPLAQDEYAALVRLWRPVSAAPGPA